MDLATALAVWRILESLGADPRSMPSFLEKARELPFSWALQATSYTFHAKPDRWFVTSAREIAPAAVQELLDEHRARVHGTCKEEVAA